MCGARVSATRKNNLQINSADSLSSGEKPVFLYIVKRRGQGGSS